MSSDVRHRILLADHEGPWRTELADALRADGLDVQETHEGKVLLQALSPDSDFRAVILGEELSDIGGFEALFQAFRAVKKSQSERPIWVICDVVADDELLQLFKKRGASDVLRRHESLDVRVDRIRTRLFAERRASTRVRLALPGQMVLGDQSIEIVSEDVSDSGSQVSASAKKVPTPPKEGEWVSLTLWLGERALEVQAEVRRAFVRKQLLGNRLVIGLRFKPLDERQKRIVRGMIEQAQTAADSLAYWNVM